MAFAEEVSLKAVGDRVRARFPDLPAEVVDEALQVARARFDGRPVREFVPILVERAAIDALRGAARDRGTPVLSG